MEPKKYRFYIGIDPGVNTGFAVWDSHFKEFTALSSMQIHKALALIKDYAISELSMKIRVEDARKASARRHFRHRSNSDARKQGAGSVKRDCKIWEDFLTDLSVDFDLVEPAANTTKLSAEAFERITKWKKKTNQHGRDAAMLVFKN